MSISKPNIPEDLAVKILNEHVKKEIEAFEQITGGENTQVFLFQSGGKKYVLKISNKKQSFLKDSFAYKHFSSNQIKIPETLVIGSSANGDKIHYTISEQCSGKTVSKLDKDVRKGLSPILMKSLDSIHEQRIDFSKGFGNWDSTGKGDSRTWRGYLLRSVRRFRFHGVFKLNRKDILESEIIKVISKNYFPLIKYCPETRQLIHGDFSHNNVLTDGNVITGVIDWGNSKYGDFLYDVAKLSFWNKGIDYETEFYDYYTKSKKDIQNYHERILCYKLHIALNALAFFSESKQLGKYNHTKERALRIV